MPGARWEHGGNATIAPSRSIARAYPMMRLPVYLLPLLLALLLAACGSKMEGTYADPTGLSKYEFEPSGKVYISLVGIKSEKKYEVDGKHVKIIDAGGGGYILTVLDDGSLEGPLGVKFSKQQKK